MWARARWEERQQSPQHAAQVQGLAARLVQMHDVEKLMAQHEFEPVAVLQQLALVGRRQKNAGEVERDRRGEAVREIRRIEKHDMRALARLPVEQRSGPA